jgi:hypothetical protein
MKLLYIYIKKHVAFFMQTLKRYTSFTALKSNSITNDVMKNNPSAYKKELINFFNLLRSKFTRKSKPEKSN